MNYVWISTSLLKGNSSKTKLTHRLLPFSKWKCWLKFGSWCETQDFRNSNIHLGKHIFSSISWQWLKQKALLRAITSFEEKFKLQHNSWAGSFFFKHQSGFGMKSAHTCLKYILLCTAFASQSPYFIANPLFYSTNAKCRRLNNLRPGTFWKTGSFDTNGWHLQYHRSLL